MCVRRRNTHTKSRREDSGAYDDEIRTQSLGARIRAAAAAAPTSRSEKNEKEQIAFFLLFPALARKSEVLGSTEKEGENKIGHKKH